MKIRLKNMKAVRDSKGRYTGVYEWEFSPVKLWWVGVVLYASLIAWLIGFDPSWDEQTIIQWMYKNIITVGSVICILAASSIATVAFLIDKCSQRKARYERIKSLRKLAHRRIPLRDGITGKPIEQPTARQFVKERMAKWQ